jgi:transglutaminase-like putative cysteine protease
MQKISLNLSVLTFVLSLTGAHGVEKSALLSDVDGALGAQFTQCVAQLKQKISSTKQILEDNPHSNLDDIIIELSPKITNIEASASTFMRDLQDGETKSLSADHEFKVGEELFIIHHNISVDTEQITPPFGGENKIYVLEYEIQIDVYHPPMLTERLTKTYRMDYANACQKQETNIKRLTFIANDASVTIEAHIFDFLNNLSTTQSIQASRASIENAFLLRNPSFMLEEGQKLPVFVDMGTGEWIMVIHYLGKKTAFDPNINQEHELETYNIKCLQGDQLVMEMHVLYSEQSEYAQYRYDFISKVSEQVKIDIWSRSSLSYTNLPEKEASFKGFHRLDFFLSNLEYTVCSPMELNFDNYEAYFTMDALSSDEEKYIYQIKNSNRSFHRELSHPFPSEIPAHAQRFLLATHYYTVNDPSIQDVVDQIKKAINDNQSQAIVLLALLEAVNEHVSYDHKALEQNSVTTIRACDTLSQGKGVCQHFAAVFVTLARAMGIPARQVSGFSMTPDADGKIKGTHHAWVEVLISGKHWLPLEPQNTRLFIKDSSYFPMMVNEEYERQIGQTTDLSEVIRYLKVYKNLVFEKTGGGIPLSETTELDPSAEPQVSK